MRTVLLLLMINFSAEAATTLKEAFDKARGNMETLKRAKAEINQAIERKKQAVAALLPGVSGVASKTWIDSPNLPGVNRAFVLSQQHMVAIRLQQPLLRGGAFSGLKERREEVLLSEFQEEASELNLYQLVLNAYYNLYFARLDLLNLQELLKFSREREKEIHSLASVGRSRKGELVQAQTQVLTAEAQYRQGETNLNEARQNFAFFTGMVPEDLAPLSAVPKELPSVTVYMEKLRERPDLKSRRQEVRVADMRVEVAKGGHYPNVDLVSNYYIDRTGVLQTSEWDLAVVVSVPFYQGGAINSQVKEGLAGRRVAELNAEEAIRAARRDLVTLYQNFGLIQQQLLTMKKALSKSEEAYKLNLKDYRFGQVTNLEVLQSLNLFVETRRAYDNLLTQLHLTYRSLEAAIGVFP